MSIPLLSPSGGKARPAQPLLGQLRLVRGRVHELCGPARQMLVAFLMRESSGPVIWIRPGWQAERLHCDGLSPLADPARLIVVNAPRGEEVLWAMEETLRSGAVALVVAEPQGLPGLTGVRRLHLAAEAGMEAARMAGGLAPLGLILSPQDGGAPGVESRWHMAPCHAAGVWRWRLSRLRARSEPPRDWLVGTDKPGQPRLLPREAQAAALEIG
jgi:protein ImuA